MAFSNKFLPIFMTGIDSATFADNYNPINPHGLPVSCSILRIINQSEGNIVISYDGINPHDYIFSMTDRTFDFQANATPTSFQGMIPKGTIIYALPDDGSPSTGFVYLAGYYQPIDSTY